MCTPSEDIAVEFDNVPTVWVGEASVVAGSPQAARGTTFVPGEKVQANMVFLNTSTSIGKATVGDDGEVKFAWTVSKDLTPGAYRVVFLGSQGGEVAAGFMVTAPGASNPIERAPESGMTGTRGNWLSRTGDGSSGVKWLVGSELLLLESAIVLLVVRRRQEV